MLRFLVPVKTPYVKFEESMRTLRVGELKMFMR